MKKRKDNKLNRNESINLYKTLQIFIYLYHDPLESKRTKNWRYKIKVYLLNHLISRNVSVFFVCEGKQFVYLFEFVEKILCKIWGFDVVVFF